MDTNGVKAKTSLLNQEILNAITLSSYILANSKVNNVSNFQKNKKIK